MLPEHEPPHAMEAARRHARISSHWLSIDEAAHQEAENRRAQRALAAGQGPVMSASSSSPRARSSSTTGFADDDGADAGGDDDGAMTLSDRRKEFRIITFILSPAVVTTFVFLILYWHEEGGCRAPLRMWCLVEAIRLVMSISLSWLLQRDVERSPRHLDNLDQLSRVMSMFSFSWFVMGHVWLVQGATSCTQTSPHLFHLTAALIILQYTLMLLPLIVLILLTPFLCLCLPCIIQGFFFFNKPQVKGATKREINKLPTEKFDEEDFVEKGYDTQCSICIADYEHNEIIRVLRCRHTFHKACIDPWLTLNGTCPICRAPIVQVATKDVSSAPRNVELTERHRSSSSATASPTSAAATSAAGDEGNEALLGNRPGDEGPHVDSSAADDSLQRHRSLLTRSSSNFSNGSVSSCLSLDVLDPQHSSAGRSTSLRLSPRSAMPIGSSPPVPAAAIPPAVAGGATSATASPEAFAAAHGPTSGWAPHTPLRQGVLRNSVSAESLHVRGRDGRSTPSRPRRNRAESASGPSALLMGNRPFTSLHSTLVRSWGLASRARAAERRRLGSDGLMFADEALGVSARGNDDDGSPNGIGWALGLGSSSSSGGSDGGSPGRHGGEAARGAQDQARGYVRGNRLNTSMGHFRTSGNLDLGNDPRVAQHSFAGVGSPSSSQSGSSSSSCASGARMI